MLEAGDALPSGVVRGLIYKELFPKKGWDARFVNRIPPSWVRRAQKAPIFSGKGKKKDGFLKGVLGAVFRLLDARVLAAARGCDVVYMSKVRSHRLVRDLKKTGARLVYDFGDAIWLPDRDSNRFFDTDKFEEILRTVDAVTTDNEFTAAYARRFNASVTPIPDYPQTELFDRARRTASAPKRGGGKTLIGWMGSPSTAYNLFEVNDALEALFAKRSDVELRLVGCGTDRKLLPRLRGVRYTTLPVYGQADMVREVMAMDVGLFPLQDTEASRVRGILKATVYMSGGAAVVSSPVGQCRDFIRDGVNGMLADGTGEWLEKLERLADDPALRRRIAEEGLRDVREKFSLEACFDQLCAVLEGKR